MDRGANHKERIAKIIKMNILEKMEYLKTVDERLESEKIKVVEILKPGVSRVMQIEHEFAEARERIIRAIYGEGMSDYSVDEIRQLLAYKKTQAVKTYNLIYKHGLRPLWAITDKALLKYKTGKGKTRVEDKLRAVEVINRENGYSRSINHACSRVLADFLLEKKIRYGSREINDYKINFRGAQNILIKCFKLMLYALLEESNSYDAKKVNEVFRSCLKKDLILLYTEEHAFLAGGKVMQKIMLFYVIYETDFSGYLKEAMENFWMRRIMDDNKIEKASPEYKKLRGVFYRLEDEIMKIIGFAVLTEKAFTLRGLDTLASYPGSAYISMAIYNKLSGYLRQELETIYKSFGIKEQFCSTRGIK